jgi:uncharacterized protein YbjT (DUF2867 family)
LEDIAKVAFAVLRQNGQEGKSYAMTGPEALSVGEIAACISRAIGKKVGYVNVTAEERRQALLAAGISSYAVDAADEQAAERRRCPESKVDLSTHLAFGIQPTTFDEFAGRHAEAFKASADRACS